MTSAALKHDALRPRRPGGMGRGLGLAVLVHVGLVIAIAFSVRWRASEPAGVSAELWAAVPQIAAPKPAEPEPPKPEPPKPKPPEPAPPKPEPVQKVDDAQIAIEKAKREEEKRKEEARREEQQRLKEEQERKQAELDRKKKEAEQKRKEEQRLAAMREDQMRRMMSQAGATGEPSSTGTAARTAGPSATYAGRIKARILPNIVFTDNVDGNPLATVEVKAAPDGTIIGRRLIKSSGVKAWDEAVLRAIDKTEVLPRDTDGRVPPSFEIAFRVRE